MNNNYTPTQFEYNAIQIILPLDLTKKISVDDELHTFIRVMEGVNLRKYLPSRKGKGRNGYNPYMMLKVVLFAYMNGIYSLRGIEKAIRNDIRFMYLTNEEKPSFKTIGEFISSLSYDIHDIFIDINKRIFELDNEIKEKDTLYLDGTAYEANANKFSFVWKKTAIKTLDKRIQEANKILNNLSLLFEEYGLITENINSSNKLDIYLIKLKDILDDVGINFVYGKGKRKTNLQRIYDRLIKLSNDMKSQEEKIRICGEDRSSYSKTDNDATFMHMKYDYYNNTGVFKPGYNLQCLIKDEYVSELYISNHRTDSKTLPFILDRYTDSYNEKPNNLVADAGYGSYDNYMYMLNKRINAYVKYNTYQKEKTSKSKTYDSSNFIYQDGKYICPNGKELLFEKEVYDDRDNYLKITSHFKCHDCLNCKNKKDCTKSEYGRSIQKNFILDELRDNAKELLDSEKGKEYRKNRSIYSEGVFGVLKQDYEYIRLHRKGKVKTELELTLVLIGFNLNKFHNKLNRDKTIH